MSGVMALSVVGVLIALAGRPTDAVMDTLPPPLQDDPASASSLLRSGDDLWDGEGVVLQTAVYPDQIVLTPTEPLRRPDPLLYWAPLANRQGELPTGARLIGAISMSPQQRLSVPEGLDLRQGHLIIYSLGHSEVLGWLTLTDLEAP